MKVVKKIAPILLISILQSCQDQSSLQMTNFDPANNAVGAQPLRNQEIQRDFDTLTNEGATFPSSMEMNDYLQNSVSPPTVDCNTKGTSVSTDDFVSSITTPAAEGAKKVLATMFQSCKSLNYIIGPETPPLQGIKKIRTGDPEIPYQRKLVNTDQYVKSHIILSQLEKDPNYPGAMCRDMTKTPPIYGYGSRKYPNRSNELNLFTEGAGVARSSKDSVAIDCSSFISVALASQGLKINKNSKGFESLTTTNFDQQVGRKNSCLDFATFKGTNSVMPGDMINVAGSHIVMIDKIGNDPLAIKKFSEIGRCDSISISDFDFSYIHSGSIKNSYGPSRVHIRTHSGGTMFNNLRIAAVKQCKKVVAGKTGEVNSQDLTSNRKFGLIRHQSDLPACKTDDKMKLKNEECVEECTE